MPAKPIFVATHPRACSTAFERVFMTRRETLKCVHEPFGDAFYHGPERLSERFEDDEAARVQSGFADTTYIDVMGQLVGNSDEEKRIFVKDMAYYLFPPNGEPAELAPSLCDATVNGSADRKLESEQISGQGGVVNPTVIPTAMLREFHFTFLIRHPRRAVPSYYRCTVPPLDEVTGFHHFMPSEAGYEELCRLFDFLREEGIVGQAASGGKTPITVIDADDLLDHPEETIRAFCKEVGIDFNPDMLRWEDKESQAQASQAFEKWNGFHNDAINSTSLKPRTHRVKTLSVAKEDEEWRQKYGEKAQRVIRDCVNANTPHYEYLKSFALKV